jgi:hypothetical protein
MRVWGGTWVFAQTGRQTPAAGAAKGRSEGVIKRAAGPDTEMKGCMLANGMRCSEAGRRQGVCGTQSTIALTAGRKGRQPHLCCQDGSGCLVWLQWGPLLCVLPRHGHNPLQRLQLQAVLSSNLV